MKKLFSLTILMIVFVFAFSLQINEFVVTGSSGWEEVEFYNETGSSIELSDYGFRIVGGAGSDSVSLPAGALAAGAYVSYTPTALGLSLTFSNSGMIFSLFNASVMIDVVGYGTYGPAPAPIYGWSTARVASTGDNAVDFNIDDSPTMGSANDAATTALGTGSVFFNECYPDSNNGFADQFIELYNSSGTGVDISDWMIMCGDDYYFAGGTIIPGNGYAVVNNPDFPTYFYLDQDKDHLYLFDNNFHRLDQFGWEDCPDGQSFSVRPNGVRTAYDGWSTATSPDFEFYTPTSGAVNPVIETLNKETLNNISVRSIPNVGIEILSNNNKGSISIMDVTGRTIYRTHMKNMIFTTKAGVYFVNIKTSDFDKNYKIEVIK